MSGGGNTRTAAPARSGTDSASRSARVVRSEWTKLWSLRSTRWALLSSVVAMAGLGILISAVQMAHWKQMSAARPRDVHPVDVSLGGWHIAAARDRRARRPRHHRRVLDRADPLDLRRRPASPARAVGEGRGLRRRHVRADAGRVARGVPRLAADPRRSTTSQTTLSRPTCCARVVGAALFLTVTGLLGLALGALVRNTAGGIATFAGVMFVLPGITAILPNSWGDSDRPLPAAQRRDVRSSRSTPDPHALAAWTGFLLFAATPLAALAASAILLVRRDA